MNKNIIIFLSCNILLNGCGYIKISRFKSKPEEYSSLSSIIVVVNSKTVNLNQYEMSGACPSETDDASLSEPFSQSVGCINSQFKFVLNLTTFTDGQYNLQVKFKSKQQRDIKLLIDRTPPALVLNSNLNDSTVSVNNSEVQNFLISGKCSTEDSLVTILISNFTDTAHCVEGYFSYSLNASSVSFGPNTVNVNQSDEAGNTSLKQFRVIKNSTSGYKITFINSSSGSDSKLLQSPSGYRLYGTVGDFTGSKYEASPNGYQIIIQSKE